ncbi:MAG: hypothetical protein DHS20C15_05950 [Planctomycetota bacterium]|nr:MAG: hypothetical protein DHS20C15_05950 [Planctomycetota bacterium]
MLGPVPHSLARHTGLLAVLLGALSCGDTPRAVFENVTDSAGLDVVLTCGEPGAKATILEVNGNGIALLDVDGDDDLDVFLVDGSTRARLLAGEGIAHHLFLNVGAARGQLRFERADVQLPLSRGWPTGVAVADVDSDGRPDLLLGGLGEDTLLLNRSSEAGLAFESRALPPSPGSTSWTTSVALADADGDGLLDAYLTRYLDIDPADPPIGAVDGLPCRFKERGVMCGPHGLHPQPDVFLRGVASPEFFVLDSERSDLRVPTPAYGLGVLFQDLDLDGWPDLYVANDSVANFLFRNLGDGRFEERARAAGAANDSAGRPQAGMGVDAADADGDGDLDLIVTNFSEESNALYRHEGKLLYRDRAIPTGLAASSRALLGWGVHLAELTGDGVVDVLFSNGHVYPEADGPDTGTSYAQPLVLLPGLGKERFDRNAFGDDSAHRGRGSVLGDLDGDGDLDLIALTLDGRPRVYRNTTDAPERQLLVSLQGAAPAHPDALGASLRVRTAAGWQVVSRRSSSGFQSVSDPRLHIAGPAPVLEAEVIWPGGARESLPPDDLRFGSWCRVRQGAGVISHELLEKTTR